MAAVNTCLHFFFKLDWIGPVRAKRTTFSVWIWLSRLSVNTLPLALLLWIYLLSVVLFVGTTVDH